MATLLGLAVALTYGCGDFFGGMAAKRTATTTVVVGSFALSAVALAVITAAWAVVGGLPSPAPHDIVLGVATGCMGPVALGFLYRGLATGRMSVVAPITAVVAAIVPLGWGIARGDRPSGLAIAGVAVALVAVALISGAPSPAEVTADDPAARRAVLGAFASGAGFGVIFVLLGSTSHHAGLWPLLTARVVAVGVTAAAMAVVVAVRGGPPSVLARLVPERSAWRFVIFSGVLDTAANATYLAAVHRGLLSIVAVLSSLYPASTVALARVILHERFHRVQVAGLVLAAVGVAAMAAG